MQNIATKMIEVMNECSHIMKNGNNSFHSYKYATCSDVLEKVNSSFVKHGIATMAIPELLGMEKVTTSKGNKEHLATVKITIMLTDAESGEVMSITGLGSGQDSGDKAVMKAQTAAIKYAYLMSLAISTGDDPEKETEPDKSSGTHTNAGAYRYGKSTPATIERKKNMVSSDKEEVCESCGAMITERVKEFSENRYGRTLCMDCQRKVRGTA